MLAYQRLSAEETAVVSVEKLGLRFGERCGTLRRELCPPGFSHFPRRFFSLFLRHRRMARYATTRMTISELTPATTAAIAKFQTNITNGIWDEPPITAGTSLSPLEGVVCSTGAVWSTGRASGSPAESVPIRNPNGSRFR